MTDPTNTDDNAPYRWELIRDILVLQVKLIIDGLRDFLLVPVSLVVGLVSLIRGGDRPGTEFYDLLRYGRRTERLINLFGAADRVQGATEDAETIPDIDTMVTRVERFLVDEYKKGGITAQAKDHMDQVLDSVRGAHRDRGN